MHRSSAEAPCVRKPQNIFSEKQADTRWIKLNHLVCIAFFNPDVIDNDYHSHSKILPFRQHS